MYAPYYTLTNCGRMERCSSFNQKGPKSNNKNLGIHKLALFPMKVTWLGLKSASFLPR